MIHGSQNLLILLNIRSVQQLLDWTDYGRLFVLRNIVLKQDLVDGFQNIGPRGAQCYGRGEGYEAAVEQSLTPVSEQNIVSVQRGLQVAREVLDDDFVGVDVVQLVDGKGDGK